MPSLEYDEEHVRVSLTGWEQLMALHRPVTVERSSIVAVEIVQHPFRALRGFRVGTWIPWVMAFGTYRHSDGKDLVAVYRKQPAVRILLRNEPYSAILASVPEPESFEVLGSTVA